MSAAGRSPKSDPLKVAIVGAGVAGSACAAELQSAGAEVVLLDKGRGAGGRLSTRRTEVGGSQLQFDHGAQYFTCRDDVMRPTVEAWERDGLVARWEGRIVVAEEGELRALESETVRYVGVPGMNSIVKALHRDLDVRFSQRVLELVAEEGSWSVRTEDLGLQADVVVLATPPSQATELMPATVSFRKPVQQVVMEPCWATMAFWKEDLGLTWDAAFVNGSALSWIARDGSKPDRGGGATWVLHASGDWSREHLEREASEVGPDLLRVFAETVGVDLPEPDLAMSHRWRFAKAEAGVSAAASSEPVEALFDPAQRVGVCGDWCPGGRVEGAWLSGRALARKVLAQMP